MTCVMTASLYASHLSAETKIYMKVIHGLYPTKKVVHIWADTKKYRHMFHNKEGIVVVDSLQDADIVFVASQKDIKTKHPKFILSHSLLKHYYQDAVGGFYWQKGRPNLLFFQSVLQKFGISLDPSLQEYIEEEL